MNKPSIHTLLQNFETEQVQRTLPDFGPGDTVVVNVKVKEGNRERVQAYEGVVIGKKNAGLNSAEIDEALALIRRIAEGGVTIVIIEHLMKVVLSVSTRIAVLHHGKLIADGPPAAVVRDPEVVAAYLGRRYAEAGAP